MGGFSDKVYGIIRHIPKGKVLTYGQVATLAGVPRAARIVGGLLYQSGIDQGLPWQRVINSRGKISTYRVGMGETQKRLLQHEGIKFSADGSLDLKRHQWWPPQGKLTRWEVSEEVVFQILERQWC